MVGREKLELSCSSIIQSPKVILSYCYITFKYKYMIYVSFGIAIKVLSLVLSLLIDIKDLILYTNFISANLFWPCSYTPLSSEKKPFMAYQNAPYFSYFQEIRKLNPNEYYTLKTQAQMAESYQQHGWSYFDLKEYRQ